MYFGGAAYSGRKAEEAAKKDRKFQERMSNTAYQRAKADMLAAGLNPLVMMPGGASTPKGSTAQVPDWSKGGDELSKGAQRKTMETQRALMAQQIATSAKQAYLYDQQGRHAGAQADITAAGLPQALADAEWIQNNKDVYFRRKTIGTGGLHSPSTWPGLVDQGVGVGGSVKGWLREKEHDWAAQTDTRKREIDRKLQHWINQSGQKTNPAVQP